MPNDPLHPTDNMDKMREAVIEHILSQIGGQAPQAPSPPQQRGLSPLQAVAGAMNPQFVPYFQQQANAPGQAQYAAQQEAFKRAMQERQDALQAGASLIGKDITADARTNSIRLQNKEYVITGSQAKSLGLDPTRGWRIRQTFDPINGTYSEPDVLGEAFVPPTVTPGVFDNKPGIGVIDRSGAGRGSANAIPGAAPPAPVEPQTRIAGGNATLANINEIKDVWKEFSQKARGPAMYQGAIDYGIQKFPGTARTVLPDQDYDVMSSFKSKIDNTVLRYVNSQSGKQYTIQELEKFRQFFPFIFDDESTVDNKLNNLRQAIQNDIAATEQQFPNAVRGAAPSSPRGSFTGRSKTREQFNRLKPSEQQRWMDGGGTVQ